MKRREFYREYYERTNRRFSDKIIWKRGQKGDSWRKGQDICHTSKFGRKCFIACQYLVLLLGFGLIGYGVYPWKTAPILLILFAFIAFISDFSIIKIELLYSVCKRESVYASLLHEAFLGKSLEICEKIRHASPKEVRSVYPVRERPFFSKLEVNCKTRTNQIFITIHRNKVTVNVNKKKTVISELTLTKEQLFKEISDAIGRGL